MADSFIETHLHLLEDFWRREESTLTHQYSFQAFGHPVRVATNNELLLAGAHISARRYSRSQLLDAVPIDLVFVLDEHLPAQPVPLDWPARLHYMGVGPWLSVHAAPWVSAFANLQTRQGVAFVSASLAEQPYLYSRYIGDCFILNMLMRNNLGQVHASCVVRDDQALLLTAPHNSGKSTTSLRLALNGYRLLSDGMTYVRTQPVCDGRSRLEFLGYPIGEAKLRMDMLDAFPRWKGAGTQAMVREDRKMVLNLRQLVPDQVLEDSFCTENVVLVVLERTTNLYTQVEAIERQEALLAVFPNSSHLDDLQVIASDLAALQALIERSRCYRMRLGSDEDGILRAVEGL